MPAGHWGILYERSGKTIEKVYPPGRHWLLTGFMPGKWQFVHIKKSEVAYQFEAKYDLPYTEILNLGDDFRISLNLRLSFEIGSNAVLTVIPYLPQDNNIEYFIRERIYIIFERKISEFMRTNADMPLLKNRLTAYITTGTLLEDLKESFKVNGKETVQFQSVLIRNIKVPDRALYEQYTGNLNEVINARRKVLLEEILSGAKLAEIDKKNKLEVDKTRLLGRMAKENPAVTEIYRIEKTNPSANTVIIDTGNKALGDKVLPPIQPADKAQKNQLEEGQVPPIER